METSKIINSDDKLLTWVERRCFWALITALVVGAQKLNAPLSRPKIKRNVKKGTSMVFLPHACLFALLKALVGVIMYRLLLKLKWSPKIGFHFLCRVSCNVDNGVYLKNYSIVTTSFEVLRYWSSFRQNFKFRIFNFAFLFGIFALHIKNI